MGAGWRPGQTTPVLSGAELTTLDGSKAAEGVRLGPFGIKVLRMTGAGRPGA